MGKGSQFLLLLWKNLVLLKRAPVRTFFQISMPLFFIVILVLLRAFEIKYERKPNVTYFAFDINGLPENLIEDATTWKMAFAPNTSDVRQVMDMVTQQLSLKKVGFRTEDEMVRVLVNEEQNEDKRAKELFLGGIAFNKGLDSGDIIYKIRLSSKSRKKLKVKRQGFGTDPSATWNTQFTFPVFENLGPRTKNATYGGPPYYYEEGFLSFQHAVNFAIIKYKGNIQDLNTTVSVKRFPYPDYILDPFILVIQQSLPLLLMLSLKFTALNIVRDIVYEKEKKLKVRKFYCGLCLLWFNFTIYFQGHNIIHKV